MQVGQLFMDATVPNGGGGAVGGGDLPSTAVPRLGVPGFNWMSQGNVCVMQWHVQVVQDLACRASLFFFFFKHSLQCLRLPLLITSANSKANRAHAANCHWPSLQGGCSSHLRLLVDASEDDCITLLAFFAARVCGCRALVAKCQNDGSLVSYKSVQIRALLQRL
jgi:hypothetical protein